MANARKKQDEKNLKTLRELGALPQNKYCFECNQRGPTYVDVTIGSFVCTKCSGILRGITPPHRVKSISMATFTTDEVELLRSKGNDFNRRVWLGLYEGTPPTHGATDEQIVRDFMVEKYERRRYYLDPSQAATTNNNNNRSHASDNNNAKTAASRINGTSIISSNNNNNGSGRLNGTSTTHRTRPEVGHKVATVAPNVLGDFVADFDKADIFSSSFNGSNNGTNQNQSNSFANFDNNPVFNSSGMPTASNLNNFNMWSNQQNLLKSQQPTPAPPPEDKYAALKDLDNEMKSASQTTLDWGGSTGSNGSLYSTPTPNGSVYSSPSPQSSVFGSPSSQSQFVNNFGSQENGVSGNPFNSTNGLIWGGSNGFSQPPQQPPFANPFHDVSLMKATNGFANFQQIQPQQQQIAFPMNGGVLGSSGTAWNPNPFKIGATTGANNTNNPFL